jgi:hypothetical protein
MKGFGELLRLMAALSFAAYVAMTIYPPTSDPANMRTTFATTFWFLGAASLLFRRADDLPLFGFVAVVSMAFVVSGDLGFAGELVAAMAVCACSIFAIGVFKRQFSHRPLYGWGAGLAIIPLSGRLIYDIYGPANFVTTTHSWFGDSTNASLSGEARFLGGYVVFVIGSVGLLYSQRLIDSMSSDFEVEM